MPAPINNVGRAGGGVEIPTTASKRCGELKAIGLGFGSSSRMAG